MTSPIEDQLAIHELLARYSHTIDGRDYAAWVDCFTPEGVLVSAMGVSSGRAELEAFARTYEESRARMPNARHFMTNIATSVDGDRATARSYVQITTSDPRGVRVLFTGQYDDTLAKVDGAWKFVERRGLPDTSIAEAAAWRAEQAKAKAG
jgi:ketosteroid isomerase-like protein